MKDFYDINPFQLGVHAGVTYYIKNGFFVEGRYNYAFDNVMEPKISIGENKYKVGTIQVGLGYKF